MASYPGAIKTFTTKTDGVSVVRAVDINEVQAEVTAIESALAINPVTITFLASGSLPPPGPKGNLLVSTGSGWAQLVVGSSAQVLTADSATATGTKWATASSGSGGGGGSISYICLQDVKGNAVDGGTFTASAWRTRDLNTVQSNSGSVLTSLSANQFVLPAGSYTIHASCPAYACGNHQARLRDITNSATLVVGTPMYCFPAGNGQNNAILAGGFVLTGATTLEIQHFCATTVSGNGFGVATTVGGEVMTYSIVEINKVA